MKNKFLFTNGSVLLILVVISVTIGFFIGEKTAPKNVTSNQSLRESNDEYKFIHPLLAVARQDINENSPSLSQLGKDVQNYISDEKSSGLLSNASVYFIDYKKNGQAFAINENDKYAPASMLKVVIMIGYLKESDSDNKIFSNSYVYNSTLANSLQDVPFENPSSLKVGQSYTVKELINKMIIDSDNGAMSLLLYNIDDSYLSEVYKNLGMSGPVDNSSDYTISAKDYSLFFRVLYNSTYLSRESSEFALSLLSKTTFIDGLVAGVPDGTTVSHKFGEHPNGNIDNITSIELHDCGYVYAKDSPYLLCVMTKSKTLDESKKVISNISKIVYNGR